MLHRDWRHGAFVLGALGAALLIPPPPASAADPPEDAPDAEGVEPSAGAAAAANAARIEALELTILRLQAAQEDAPEESSEVELKAYSGGQRALQALNPEISAVSDFFARYIHSETGKDYIGGERSGGFLRVMGLHLQANLDPFSFTKITAAFSPTGAAIGEAYVTWTSVFPGVSLTAGRFRQQLGVVNRWHKHGLDQFDHPPMITVPFGGGGLTQTGVSLHATLPPVWSDGLELTLEVTNGSNEAAFSGAFFSVPSGLLRLQNYWDLSDDTYLELGLTGMLGANNQRGLVGGSGEVIDEALRGTYIGGLDLTVNWEPLERSKYHHFTWRSELLYLVKELEDDTQLTWMGAYSYVEYKLDRSWLVGLRGDATQPLAVDNSGQWDFGATPYITWWQSPWVRLHLEYQARFADGGDIDHRVILQLVAAVGPHKHERY